MADIFLSYKKEDRGRIDTLASALKSEGFDVWFDYEIETGGDWFDQILMQLRQAHCVVGCWSNVSVQDGIFTRSTNSNLSYVQTEHREAGAKLLPILLDADAVPVEFGSLQAEDLTDWVGDTSDARWRRFIDRIEELVAHHAPAWIRRRMASVNATLIAERARRTDTEERASALNEQLKVEARQQADALRELAVSNTRAEDMAEQIDTLKQQLHEKTDEIANTKAILKTTVQKIEDLTGKLLESEKARTAQEEQLKSAEDLIKSKDKTLKIMKAQLHKFSPASSDRSASLDELFAAGEAAAADSGTQFTPTVLTKDNSIQSQIAAARSSRRRTSNVFDSKPPKPLHEFLINKKSLSIITTSLTGLLVLIIFGLPAIQLVSSNLGYLVLVIPAALLGAYFFHGAYDEPPRTISILSGIAAGLLMAGWMMNTPFNEDLSATTIGPASLFTAFVVTAFILDYANDWEWNRWLLLPPILCLMIASKTATAPPLISGGDVTWLDYSMLIALIISAASMAGLIVHYHYPDRRDLIFTYLGAAIIGAAVSLLICTNASAIFSGLALLTNTPLELGDFWSATGDVDQKLLAVMLASISGAVVGVVSERFI